MYKLREKFTKTEHNNFELFLFIPIISVLVKRNKHKTTILWKKNLSEIEYFII